MKTLKELTDWQCEHFLRASTPSKLQHNKDKEMIVELFNMASNLMEVVMVYGDNVLNVTNPLEFAYSVAEGTWKIDIHK